VRDRFVNSIALLLAVKMGKVSKSKKRSGNVNKSAPYSPKESKPDESSTSLLNDLKSIDPLNREKACNIISSVFSGQLGNASISRSSAETLLTNDFLNHLRARLVDQMAFVKYAAINAVK
jgi:hypothetical protein